jgi:hypothetical protein
MLRALLLHKSPADSVFCKQEKRSWDENFSRAIYDPEMILIIKVDKSSDFVVEMISRKF